jgi:hypothetical protein
VIDQNPYESPRYDVPFDPGTSNLTFFQLNSTKLTVREYRWISRAASHLPRSPLAHRRRWIDADLDHPSNDQSKAEPQLKGVPAGQHGTEFRVGASLDP